MSNKNEVFEYLIDQLRQQVNTNQCEDLAHEVQSLKSELARYKKPYIAYVKKTDWVQRDSRFVKKWGKHRADILRECIQEQDAELQSLKNQLRDASAQIKELHLALVDELLGTITLMNGKSSCRKEDTQECYHNWRFVNGKAPAVCINCGVTKSSECEHEWKFYGAGFPCMCIKCGLKK